MANDLSVQILIEEAKLTVDVAQRKYAAFSQFGGIGIAVIVATASLASESNRRIIFLAAPLILALIGTVLLQQFADALAISYYHSQLQVRLNEFMPAESKLKYHEVVNLRTYWSIPTSQLLLLLLIGSSYGVAWVTAVHSSAYHRPIVIYFWFALVLGVLSLAAGFRDVFTSENQAKELYLGGKLGREGLRGGLGLR